MSIQAACVKVDEVEGFVYGKKHPSLGDDPENESHIYGPCTKCESRTAPHLGTQILNQLFLQGEYTVLVVMEH